MIIGMRRPPMEHPDYLAYVRALPCVATGIYGQNRAHHCIADRYGSRKVSDVLSMPLIDPQHLLLHEDWPAWEAEYGSQWMHVAKTCEQAVRDGVWVLDKRVARALSNGMGNP